MTDPEIVKRARAILALRKIYVPKTKFTVKDMIRFEEIMDRLRRNPDLWDVILEMTPTKTYNVDAILKEDNE